MQRLSEIKANLDSGATSIHSFPLRTTGHDRLHSCRHFYTGVNSLRAHVTLSARDWAPHTLGLHLSLLTMAIRVSLSLIVASGGPVYRGRQLGGGESEP
ncbi:hypothetical protein BX600DRAFT_197716 [Xylariales sp. PMI_506]|nr:hypothetical protein BX600DRAFT_197716 [Xylariales sp. PMI_506]